LGFISGMKSAMTIPAVSSFFLLHCI